MEILSVLVGSRAHGLNTPESDYDYRGVFVNPTRKIVAMEKFRDAKSTSWIEGDIDQTSYEIGHFLHLASKGNPSILELMVGPVSHVSQLGIELRTMLPYMVDTQSVVNSFCGYSLNQRKKMFDDHMNRRWKYAVAYLRVLIMGEQLVRTGTMTLKVPDAWKEYLIDVRDGRVLVGDVINVGISLDAKLRKAAEDSQPRIVDHEKLNEFLLRVRKENW